MSKALATSTIYRSPEPPGRKFRFGRMFLFVVLSVAVHLSVALTLKKVSSVAPPAEPAPPSRVEFEVLDIPAQAPPDAATPAPAPPRPAEVRPEPAPPPVVSPQRIVELPDAPEVDEPEDARYLAERNMRAEKDTIADKVGEATNERQEGATVAQSGETDRQQEEQKPVAEKEAVAGPEQAAPAIEPEAAPAAPPAPAAEQAPQLSDRGDVAVPAPSALEEGSERAAPRGQAGSAPAPGIRSLMPSQEQLAKSIAPAQRNLIEAQRGDITLLNAKSSEMAKYIIARAKRIYSYLNINAPLLTIYYEDVEGMQFPIAVEAEIDRNGMVLAVRTVISSGSGKLDGLVSDACRSGLQGNPKPPDEGFGNNDTFRFRFALYEDHIEAGTP